jgi:pimeloyl-[acyl-carrier protein] methyl ester esterase
MMGDGPNLVMLHGWSMHSAVWHDLAKGLAKHFTLHLVDLPGHGLSEWQQGDLELDNLLATLAQQLPDNAYFMGWSLGGLVSVAFADRFPQRVTKLILMAATPRFVQANDWTCAMESKVFEQFAENLDENQENTLQRFLLLQARGAQHSKETIRHLSHQLAIESPPNAAALKAGLKLLMSTDMRKQFAELICPVQIILGDRDTLIPVDMLIATKKIKPDLEYVELTGAGHAPFISQPQQCQLAIEQFLNG